MCICHVWLHAILSLSDCYHIGKLNKGATKTMGSDKEEIVQEPVDAVDG